MNWQDLRIAFMLLPKREIRHPVLSRPSVFTKHQRHVQQLTLALYWRHG